MSILQVVKGCPLFYELYDQEILDIVKLCRVLNLEKGDHVFKEGEEGNEIFLILTGSATVMKDEYAIAKLRRGDLFGEMVLLQDNVRHANVVIDNFTDILLIDYDDIFSHYQTNSKIFSILMLNLARMLASRLQDAGQLIQKLQIENKDLKKQKTAA